MIISVIGSRKTPFSQVAETAFFIRKVFRVDQRK